MCLSARLTFTRAPSQIGISFLRLRYDNTMTIEHKPIVSLEARSAGFTVCGPSRRHGMTRCMEETRTARSEVRATCSFTLIIAWEVCRRPTTCGHRRASTCACQIPFVSVLVSSLFGKPLDSSIWEPGLSSVFRDHSATILIS